MTKKEFKGEIDQLVGRYVPTKSLGGSKNLQWVTQEIRRKMNQRDQLYQVQKKSGKDEDRRKFKKRKSLNQSAADSPNGSMGESSNDKMVTMETKLPRKQSVVWVAMKSVKTKLSLTEEGASPVNWKVIFLVFVSLFSSSFTMTILFPFLPEMIKSFGYKEEEKGYYAGIVASAMFGGRAFGSYFWGWLSDKKGRKPIMLVTIILNGVVSLAFGFTTNIVYAFVTRFLTGLVNGTVIISKTVLYEISDNTNQAVGMSIISVAWGIGLVAGPTVGGYLANPCKRYPDTFPPEGLFYNFPYLIPGAIACLICLFAFVIDLIWLPETLRMKDEELEIEVDCSEDVLEPSAHDRLKLNGPPSMFGSKSYLSDAKAAISMEDLHLESESATYLAKSGKEIHFTRHGIEFTDVKDGETKRTKNNGNIGQENTKHLDQNGGNFYLDMEKHASRECVNNEHRDTDKFGCDTDMVQCDADNDRNDTQKNSQMYNQDHNDISGKNISLESKTDHNNVNNFLDNIEPDTYESEKLLDQQRETLTVNDVLEDEKGLSSRKTGSRICHMCGMIGDLSVVKLIRQFDVFLVTTLYSVFSFGAIGFEEIFTVWCSTDVLYDGLGYEPNEIGAVMGTSSIPLLLLQFILFPNLVRRFGAKKTFLCCAVVNVISISIMPTLHLLRQPSLLWILLVADNIIIKVMTSCIFSATSLFINNSVTPDLAGSVNGLSMTVTAATRSLAPIVGGAVFAWTVSYSSENIGPPFDISFTFFMFGLIIWLLTVGGITIPERLNKQKK